VRGETPILAAVASANVGEIISSTLRPKARARRGIIHRLYLKKEKVL